MKTAEARPCASAEHRFRLLRHVHRLAQLVDEVEQREARLGDAQKKYSEQQLGRLASVRELLRPTWQNWMQGTAIMSLSEEFGLLNQCVEKIGSLDLGSENGEILEKLEILRSARRDLPEVLRAIRVIVV